MSSMNINNYIGEEDLKSAPYSQRAQPHLHLLAQTDSPDHQDASSKGDYFLRESLPQDFLMDLSHVGAPLIGTPLEGGLNFAARIRYTQALEYSEDQPLPSMCIMDEEQAEYTERSKLAGDDQEQLDKEFEEEEGDQEVYEQSPEMEGPEETVIELQQITLEKVGEPLISAGTDEMLEQDKNGVAAQKKQKKLLFYVHGGNYPETVSEALIARGNWQQYPLETECIEKCHFVWKPFNYNADGYKRIDKRVTLKHSAFIYNHFEVLKGLVTKSGLIRSLKQYYYNNDSARQASYTIFDSTPTTFLLQSGCDDSEWAEFNQRYKDIQRGYAPKERIPIKHCVNNIWLVKPANANQGRGIEIFSELDEMTQFIHSRPQFTCCVVQKYIERPLLFKGRKFDIRVWALVNCKNEVFMYRHGYLRTSSDDYNLTNGNNYVHLTNNCLQKFGTNYGVHEDGNTVGFHIFQAYLDEHYPQYGMSVERDFIPKMKDLIIDTFNATKAQLNPNRRKHVFELLGYDFLIDEDFRLWLIEVNTNPYFGVPNSYIADLLPKMMDDLFDIVVDPIYPPDVKPPRLEKPNDFELIYSEALAVNQRRSFGTSHYPVTDLAQQVGHKAARQDLKYLRQFKIMNLNLSTYGFKKAKEQPGKPNIHQAQILVHANQANRARNSVAALRTANNQSNVRQQRAREASSEQKQRSKSLMLGGIGAPRCIVSIQPSPAKKNVEITQSSQLKTIQAKVSESMCRQNSKPRFSTSLAQHSLSRQYGMGKKGVNGSSINQAAILSHPSFITKHGGGSSENRPQTTTTASSQDDKMIKFRKFLNKSQAQTPTKAKELNTVEQSRSPPIEQKEEEVQQIQIALIQKKSTNTGESSVKSDQTNSSLVNQNIPQTVVKIHEDMPKMQQQTSSFDIFSNASSQEKFVSRRLREKSFERLTNSAQERHGLTKTDPFEVLFSTLLTRVGKETQDDLIIRDNLNTLQSLIDLNMHELIRQERYLIDLLGVAVRECQHIMIASHLLGIIDLFKDRLHFKQTLSRNVTLQKFMIKMYTQTRDQEVRKRILKILAAMSCADEASKKLESPKKDKDTSIELGRGRSSTSKTRANPHKAAANADTSSLNIIRQSIYRKAVQNGLILFLLSRSSDTWLLNLLNQSDKHEILSQLSSIVNMDQEPKYPAPPESFGLDINTDSENTFATIERSVQHRINIIDLSREEKPIEVYNGELFPSKGQQLLQLVKSVIPLESAVDLMTQLQVSSEPELIEQSAVDNSRVSGKSSGEKPSYKRRQQQRDESITLPNSSILTSPQPIPSQKTAIKKKETPESSSFKGNAQIGGQSKSPFTGTAIKFKGNMSPMKQSIVVSNKPNEGRRQHSPSFIKKEPSVDQKSPPGPQGQKKSAKKLGKASKNVTSIDKPSTNALKSRLKQVDETILNSKQKPNKFKPVLKSKVPSVTSTPYAQQSQLKKQPSLNPFVNPIPMDRRKSAAQNPQKRLIGSQLNSRFNADLMVHDDSKPKVVLQGETFIANSSTRKSGNSSQLSHYKNQTTDSQFNPQLSYYQESSSQKPKHKYKRNPEEVGNLQRAVMDSMEKKIQEIQESLNTIQNRQRKVASPKCSDNSDLQMVNYHNKRERMTMQESVPNLYLPFQRASVGLQNTNETLTSERKVQNTVSGSHHYHLDSADRFDKEDRIKLFSTIQETRAISPRQSKYQQLFIQPKNFDFPLQRQNQLNGTLTSKNSSKIEDPHSSQSNRNQGSTNVNCTYGRMGRQKSPTYIDLV